jgi:isoquinoline 1-oxidoreductase beta subunit
MTLSLENVTRRAFLIGGAATMGSLVIGLRLIPHGFAKTPSVALAQDVPEYNPVAFVAIDGSGLVTITAHRAEMGQGIRTTLPMAVAEELEADWSRVRVVQAVGDEAVYGGQNTDGSRSLRHFLLPMRQMGAAVRQMLETAAAEAWGVDVGEVRARYHQVVHTPTGRTVDYGEIAAAASERLVPSPEHLRLKSPADFRYLGKGRPIVDLSDMTSGRAGYGIDVRLPEMKHAVIARPPVYGGRLISFDAAAALAVPGVERVVKLDGAAPPSGFRPLGGVAVVARNTWAAIQGRGKLKLTWDDGPNATYDSAAYRTQLEQTASRPGKVVRNEGDAPGALAATARLVTADYYVPHIAHSADGAAGRGGPRRRRPLRGVGVHAESAGRARRDRPRARDGDRSGPSERDAARRRLRTQVEARLRCRGGSAGPSGRCARQGDVDA